MDSVESRLIGYTWEPYTHGYDNGQKVEGFRLSNGRGYVLPTEKGDSWWVTWAHPMLCGRPGWHHHAFGSYASASAGMLAFEEVYALEYATGNSDRCDLREKQDD